MKFSLCDIGACRCRQIPKVTEQQYEDWSRKAEKHADEFHVPPAPLTDGPDELRLGQDD